MQCSTIGPSAGDPFHRDPAWPTDLAPVKIRQGYHDEPRSEPSLVLGQVVDRDIVYMVSIPLHMIHFRRDRTFKEFCLAGNAEGYTC